MELSVKVDTKGALAYLSRVQRKQIPYAIKSALDATAFDARKAVQVQLPRKLDRPTPATIKGVRVGKATKSRLVSSVYFVDHVAKYMKFQVGGGTRRPKRRALPVPFKVARNRFGNMSRSKIKQLLASPKTFSGTVKGVSGIWQRTGGKRNPGLKLLIAWESSANYQARFPFNKIVKGVVRSKFPQNFKRSLRHALRTAR